MPTLGPRIGNRADWIACLHTAPRQIPLRARLHASNKRFLRNPSSPKSTQITLSSRLSSIRRRCGIFRICSEGEEESSTPEPKSELELPPWVSTAGVFTIWAAFLGYSLFLSPNQTPNRDLYLIEKFLNLAPDDGFHINTVFNSIFYLFGVVPLIYAPLILPSGKTKNKIPAWPFLIGMFFLGNLFFLPYAALWQPDPSITAPPSKSDMDGWRNLWLRVTESTLLPVLVLVPTLWYVFQMAFCGGEEWAAFLKYFEESRLVHNSTVDLTSLILLLPFWMGNDATRRDWSAKDQLLPVLSCIPLFGPVVYLILRPKAER